MLNNQWLSTFKTLVEVGHFTQTAEKLNMTQPGVSQHIKKLEDSCGKSLIKKVGKGFELTEEGRLVYEYSVSLFKEEKSLMESLKFDNPFLGDCYLSCSGSLALKLYSPILDLQKVHSKLVVHIEAAPNGKILKDIENGVIDIGIVTDNPSRNIFDYKKIGSEPLFLILPKRYKGRSITAELLKECGLVNHPDAKMYLSLYLEQINNPDLDGLDCESIPIVSYVNQLAQIPLSVSKGIGFTILPWSAIESFGKRSTYLVDRPEKIIAEDLYLVQKKNRSLPSRYKIIEDYIREILNRV
ncbi:LysR family transcriptional regulator [Halobacteriovorax sp.]|uniref:LysR family transcriptional regulator n=1 Tax=Halobacteriovorax sp. TaxID=2020862 RepID=UPI003564C7BC